MLADCLSECANEEVLCHPYEDRRDFGALVSLLRRVFGPRETVTVDIYSTMSHGRSFLRHTL